MSVIGVTLEFLVTRWKRLQNDDRCVLLASRWNRDSGWARQIQGSGSLIPAGRMDLMHRLSSECHPTVFKAFLEFFLSINCVHVLDSNRRIT